MAGTPKVFQTTMNRDHFRRARDAMRARLPEDEIEESNLPDVGEDSTFGKPEAIITGAVDSTPYLEYKRAAMRAHASQIGEQSFFLTMPDEAFAYAFGTEWFIRDGQGPGITERDLFS